MVETSDNDDVERGVVEGLVDSVVELGELESIDDDADKVEDDDDDVMSELPLDVVSDMSGVKLLNDDVGVAVGNESRRDELMIEEAAVFEAAAMCAF